MKRHIRKIRIIIMLVMLLFTANSSIMTKFVVDATAPEVLESNRYLFTLPAITSEEWRAITVTEPCSSIDVTVTGTFDNPVSFGVYASQDTTSVAIAEFTEELAYRKGDINKDGLVDSADAAIALNLYKYNNATAENIKLGDMDENGMIDSADAAMILNIFKYNL